MIRALLAVLLLGCIEAPINHGPIDDEQFPCCDPKRQRDGGDESCFSAQACVIPDAFIRCAFFGDGGPFESRQSFAACWRVNGCVRC